MGVCQKYIFNPEKTVRDQMIKGFALLSGCALLSVFLVALVVVLALAGATSSTAESNLEARLKDHSLLTTKEIARVIGQKLELISETVVMTLASQSRALLSLQVGGDDPDAPVWPYKYRPVLKDFTLCQQDDIDATYSQSGNWCSRGFAQTNEEGHADPAAGCGDAPYKKGSGWPQASECFIDNNGVVSSGQNGFCEDEQYTTSQLCTDAGKVWTTNTEIATAAGWGSDVHRIARAAPTDANGVTAESNQLGSEKVASVSIQHSNAGCDNNPRKIVETTGEPSAAGTCNYEQYSVRSTQRYNELISTGYGPLGGSESFKHVIDRTQMLDIYAKPLWEEYSELALAYVAYQSPKLPYDADGTPSNKMKEYLAAMRRFPGQFSFNNSYDPTKRGWWKSAMKKYEADDGKLSDFVGDVIMTSAYRDFTTRIWMVTISQAFEWGAYVNVPDGRGVASADVELEDMQAAVLGIDFSENSFAGLVHLASKAVLSLDGKTIDAPKCKLDANSDTAECKETKTLKELETDFPQEDLDKFLAGKSGTVEYKRKTDNGAEDWVVAYAPAFGGELGVLLFASKDEIKATVAALGDKVGETTATVVGVVVGVVLVTAFITLLVVWLVVRAISNPLKNIQEVSSRIVKTSADSNRHFRSHLKKIDNVSKGDEIGDLVHQFRKMVRGLHDADAKKRKAPKYPKNDLYGQDNQPWHEPLRLQSNF